MTKDDLDDCYLLLGKLADLVSRGNPLFTEIAQMRSKLRRSVPEPPATNPVVQALAAMCECEADMPVCLFCQAANEIARLEKLVPVEPTPPLPKTPKAGDICPKCGGVWTSCSNVGGIAHTCNI